MPRKYLLLGLALTLCLSTYSQKEPPFGVLTEEEITYEWPATKEPANAVVLFEKGDNYFEVINNRILLVKKFHTRIKILNEQGYDEGTISIPYYKGENASERIEGLRAITHNGHTRVNLMPDAIYTNDINERWSEQKFTFPKMAAGSVLEYEYKLISPFFYLFSGWDFQSNLPKLYSEFNAKIPGNYRYNRNLKGSLVLAVNDAKLIKECFKIDGIPQAADCEVLTYIMKDIPAFKEEDFMLGRTNFVSGIEFELSEYHRLNGVTERFTRSWRDVDREFKTDRDIGRQLNKENFFEKNVPESLLTEGTELERAENIYQFVRDHYTWNGRYGIYRDIRVKEAFEKKSGNIGEINITLINLLNSAGLDAQLMMTSTRENGLPKKTHPVMADFNYLIAKLNIGGQDYLLDASDRHNPFGMLPFHCLNYYGRVMDFKEDSYWHPISVDEKSQKLLRAQLQIDPQTGTVSGMLDEVNRGYDAVDRYRRLAGETPESQEQWLEARLPIGFHITDYKFLEDRSNEKMVYERMEFEWEEALKGGKLYINPFLMKFFDHNPFQVTDRQFPVDFGHNRAYSLNLGMEIPEGYEIERIPKSRKGSLPDGRGGLAFDCQLNGRNLTLNYTLLLNTTLVSVPEYPSLRELFLQALEVQDNSLIVIRPVKKATKAP